MVIFQAWHSDKTRDRGYHVMLSSAISCIGYIILATAVQKSVGAAYFALFLVVGGNFSLFPLVMWVPNPMFPNRQSLTLVIQELGCQCILTNFETRRWYGFYCFCVKLRVYVRAFSVYPRSMLTGHVISSASPQIYFDADDNFRKGHAISAG